MSFCKAELAIRNLGTFYEWQIFLDTQTYTHFGYCFVNYNNYNDVHNEKVS